MKVRALVAFASPVASPAEGEVVDVPEAQAAAWLKARLVELVPPEARVVQEAVRSTPETAVVRRTRGR